LFEVWKYFLLAVRSDIAVTSDCRKLLYQMNLLSKPLDWKCVRLVFRRDKGQFIKNI